MWECVELAAIPSDDRKQLDYVVARLRIVIAARTFELVLVFGGELIVYECPHIGFIVIVLIYPVLRALVILFSGKLSHFECVVV
jgi:hypothetical protein